jgi:uncharacterized protein
MRVHSGNLSSGWAYIVINQLKAIAGKGSSSSSFLKVMARLFCCDSVTVLKSIAIISLLLGVLAPPSVSAAEKPSVKSLLEMRQDGVVLQKWDLSCGAAALATVLSYQHDDPIPEREIAAALMQREEYIANPAVVQVRQGFSLLDLKRYVDSRGYQGIGYGELTLQTLVKFAPIMVPVNLHGYNHFVVFRGVRGGKVLLADPAWGNRTMDVKRFEAAWIKYPEIGKVGFVVARQDGPAPPNRLAVRERDFVMF